MLKNQLKIKFLPFGKTVYVLPRTSMLEAASRAGLTLETTCGGAGTCGKCRVKIVSGNVEITESNHHFFSQNELNEGWRLGCHAVLSEETVVEIPKSSLFATQIQIMVDSDTVHDEEMESRSPQRPDSNLSQISFGAAFDVGTTSLVCAVFNLQTGEQHASVARLNLQTHYGDDVLSRIKFTDSNLDGLEILHKIILDEVVDMIKTACNDSNIICENIREIAFAGNSTMQHLLCGYPVSQLGQFPFEPFNKNSITTSGKNFNLPFNNAEIFTFPIISGFVGGDTVSCILATKMYESNQPILLIDIGTNGELVLAHNRELWAASAAAGPVFEGARISCGMRAANGAIEKLIFNDDLVLSVIGDVEPIGLCGSGLIDIIALLLEFRIVESVGRLLPPEELSEACPENLKKRVQIAENGEPEFVLYNDITLTQKDVREFQLAAGAMRAGINILLKEAKIDAEKLKRVYIAGGFGSFIRRSSAQRIGIIPQQVNHNKIQYVGNASLSGARGTILLPGLRKISEEIAIKTKHVELSTSVDFQMEFAEAMIFPEP